MKTEEIFISNNSILYDEIIKYEYPYEILPNIKEIILEKGKTLKEDYIKKGEDIWIHKTATVNESAYIKGPTIICEGADIRHCAFIRGSVVVGANSVVGNSTEIKNAILFDFVEVPHLNYIGDSIIGYNSHLGATSVISNLKNDRSIIKIKYKDKTYNTNLIKVGAFLGDNVSVGCGSVINPGTIIKRNSSIYPLVSVRGVIEEEKIVKTM